MSVDVVDEAWAAYEAQQGNLGATLPWTLDQLLHKIASVEGETVDADEAARNQVVHELSQRLAAVGAELGTQLGLEVHGAFLSGCYVASSTLELAVVTPNAVEPGSGDVELRGAGERLVLLERVRSVVSDSGLAAQGTLSQVNRAARIPSISFEHAGSGIPVRLCIAYPGFAFRAHVLRGLVQLEPRLRSLVQLVELWAEARGLSNPAAGTFNSWALAQLAIFAMQTFRPQPLLPPLWRLCTPSDGLPAATSAGGAGGSGGPAAAAGGSGGGAGAGASAPAAAAMGVGVGGSAVCRPLQHASYVRAPSSSALAPVLQDILARLSGTSLDALASQPADGAAPPSGLSTAAVGLLPLFHWFLVLTEKLMARWQLSWNRRWRVSTWHGQMVQQPFNRAFLVLLECPFDPADNAAKSFGCENQPKHQEAFRAACGEVAASLRLLQATKSPADIDRLMLGLFGLEVEHLYLEEEEEEEEEVQAQAALGADASPPQLGLQARTGADDACIPLPRPSDEPAAGGSGCKGGPGGKGATGRSRSSSPLWHPLMAEPTLGSAEPRAGAGPEVKAGVADPEARTQGEGSGLGAQELSVWDLMIEDAVLVDASDCVAANVRPASMIQPGGAPAGAEAGGCQTPQKAGGSSACAAEPGAGGATPPLPVSMPAGGFPGTPQNAAATLRANARVQRPLSPLLRDVTNGLHRSASGGGPEPKPRGGPPSASPRTGEPGYDTPLFGNPFEDFFGGLLEGAKRLFDNVAQGVAELGEDINEFAATTAATIRAVINDDEDLPFLVSSARKARRHRLQLLHRAPGSAAAAGGGSGFATPPSAGDSGSKLQYGRRSPPSSGPHRGAPGQGMSPRVGSRPGSGRLAAGAAGMGKGSPTLAGGQWVLPVSRGKVVTAAPAASPETVKGQAWLLSQQQQQGPARALDLPSVSEEAGPTADEVSAAVDPTQLQAASPPLQQAELGMRAVAAAKLGPLPAAAAAASGPTSGQGVTGGLLHPLADQGRSMAELPALIAAADLKIELQQGPSTEQGAAPAETASCGQRPGGTTVEPAVLSTSQASQASTQQPAAGVSGDATTVGTPARADPPEGRSTGGMALPSLPQQRQQQKPTAQDVRGPGPAAPAAPAARGLLRPSSMPAAASPVTARASGGGLAAAPGRSFSLPRRTPVAAAGAAPLAEVLSGRSTAAPLPPPPPPPPPPLGLGGLRVKSAAFRKASTRDAHAAIAAAVGSAAAGAAATNSSTTSSSDITAPSLPSVTFPLPTAAPTTLAQPEDPTGGAAAAAATAATSGPGLVQQPSRTLLQLTSGRLQELAECIDRAGPCTTIDLCGGTFSGPLQHPAMKLSAADVAIVNGQLLLQPEQYITVTARGAQMTDVVIGAAPGAGLGAAVPSPRVHKPAVLVTKQSYAAGGELALLRCRVELGDRAHGLQAKGKGCRITADSCTVEGCSVAALASANDASVRLSDCTLSGGAGHGLCVRDNGSCSASRCTLSGFGVACAGVLTGGALELSGCTLRGRANASSQEGNGSGNGSGAAGAVEGGGGGGGVVVEGKGSSAVVKGCSLGGYTGWAALAVAAGGTCTAEDCQMTGSLQGAQVGPRGGRLHAARCSLADNAGEGLAVGEGATAELRECSLTGNGAAGARVGGVGSTAVLRSCGAKANGGDGVRVEAGGWANLDSCEVHGNGAGAGAGAAGEGCGLAVAGAGARATVIGSGFEGNRRSGVRVEESGAVVMKKCRTAGNGERGGVVGGVGVEVGPRGQADLSGACDVGEEGGAGGGVVVSDHGCLKRSS